MDRTSLVSARRYKSDELIYSQLRDMCATCCSALQSHVTPVRISQSGRPMEELTTSIVELNQIINFTLYELEEWHKIFDATLEEECSSISCDDGTTRVANLQHVPKFDGCGSFGIQWES